MSVSTDFGNRLVMAIISNLITTYNATSQAVPSERLSVAQWVTSMVNIFGLNGTGRPDDRTIGWSGIDVPANAKPVLSILSQKRNTLRQKVCNSQAKSASVEFGNKSY